MTEIRNYAYTSVLSPYIEGFIAEKRSLGFIYNSEAYELFRLDAYWNEKKYSDPLLFQNIYTCSGNNGRNTSPDASYSDRSICKN